MNTALADEILSVNAIYGDLTLTPTSTPTTLILRPPTSSISLRIDFPLDYPDSPPTITGSDSSGSAAIPKGTATQLVATTRTLLAEVYRAGEPCIYDLLEALATHIHSPPPRPRSPAEPSPSEEEVVEEEEVIAPEWFLAAPVTEKKSTFIARAARVTSPAQARAFIAHLLTHDKRVARATHNMTAWRIRGGVGVAYADYDSDGETAAGSRLGKLLATMDVWDVVVVVSRWYGGVLLGPDRFRIIGAVAREAVVGVVAQDGRE